MKSLLDIIKLLLFPQRCGICGEVVEFDEEFCEECKKLKFIEAPICLKCGCSKNDCTCKNGGRKRETEYKAIVAPYYYENTVRHGVLNFKMHDMPFLAEHQGKAISKAVDMNYELIDFDFVTFVPMRKKDEIKREFNQSRLLAEVVSANCGIPLQDVLVKVKNTKKQKRLSRENRFLNVYNAFRIKPGFDVTDARILLIDDVKTTGSTLKSASMTLKANGAKAVYCAVFAIRK